MHEIVHNNDDEKENALLLVVSCQNEEVKSRNPKGSQGQLVWPSQNAQTMTSQQQRGHLGLLPAVAGGSVARRRAPRMSSFSFMQILLPLLLQTTTIVPTVNGWMMVPGSMENAASLVTPSMSLLHAPSLLLLLHDPSSSISVSSAASATTTPSLLHIPNFLDGYMRALTRFPLATKMMTGATLAWTGDFMAQSRMAATTTTTTSSSSSNSSSEKDSIYDKKRGISFALFDASYRATQHYLYPLVVQACQGTVLMGLLPILKPDMASAMEQTLVAQLLIVPLLYYPVFYAVTSYVQQGSLDLAQIQERAQRTFLPLMKRNLLFWIPVQFIQFSFLPEEWQIPFLSVGGLCWTMILSVLAGSAVHQSSREDEEDALDTAITTTTTTATTVITINTKEQEQEEEIVYCVTGMEEECILPPDGLFPETSLKDVAHELQDMVHDVQEVAEEMVHDLAEHVTHDLEEVTQEVAQEMEDLTQKVTHEWEEFFHQKDDKNHNNDRQIADSNEVTKVTEEAQEQQDKKMESSSLSLRK